MAKVLLKGNEALAEAALAAGWISDYSSDRDSGVFIMENGRCRWSIYSGRI